MLAIFFLSLIGVAMADIMFTSEDPQTGDQTVEDPNIIVEDYLNIDNETEQVFLTEDDDIFNTIDHYSTDTFFVEVFMNDGDDHATIASETPYAPYWIYGEGGNDTLITENGSGALDGGAGDDTLISYGHANLEGGDGNDLIHAYVDGEHASNQAFLDGASGNDTINIEVGTGNSVLNFQLYDGTIDGEEEVLPDSWLPDSPLVSTGDGADLINLTLNVHNETFPEIFEHETFDEENLGPKVAEGQGITIRDFDPEQDQFVVNIERVDDNADRAGTMTATQEQSDAGYLTTLTFEFEAQDDAVKAKSVIYIRSDTPFDTSLIEVNGLNIA